MSNCNCCGGTESTCLCKLDGGCCESRCISKHIKVKRSGWANVSTAGVVTPLNNEISTIRAINKVQKLNNEAGNGRLFSHGYSTPPGGAGFLPNGLSMYAMTAPGLHGTINANSNTISPAKLTNFKYITLLNISAKNTRYIYSLIGIGGRPFLSSEVNELTTTANIYNPITVYILATCVINGNVNNRKFFVKPFTTLQNQTGQVTLTGDLDLIAGWSSIPNTSVVQGNPVGSFGFQYTMLNITANNPIPSGGNSDITGFSHIAFTLLFTSESVQMPVPTVLGQSTITDGYVISIGGNMAVYGRVEMQDWRNQYGNPVPLEINECWCHIIQQGAFTGNPNFVVQNSNFQCGNLVCAWVPLVLVYNPPTCATGMARRDAPISFEWDFDICGIMTDFSSCGIITEYSLDSFETLFGVTYHRVHGDFQHLSDACNYYIETGCGFIHRTVLFGIEEIGPIATSTITYDDNSETWVLDNNCISCTFEVGAFGANDMFDTKFTYTLKAACFATPKTVEVYGQCNGSPTEALASIQLKYNLDGSVRQSGFRVSIDLEGFC